MLERQPNDIKGSERQGFDDKSNLNTARDPRTLGERALGGFAKNAEVTTSDSLLKDASALQRNAFQDKGLGMTAIETETQDDLLKVRSLLRELDPEETGYGLPVEIVQDDETVAEFLPIDRHASEALNKPRKRFGPKDLDELLPVYEELEKLSFDYIRKTQQAQLLLDGVADTPEKEDLAAKILLKQQAAKELFFTSSQWVNDANYIIRRDMKKTRTSRWYIDTSVCS